MSRVLTIELPDDMSIVTFTLVGVHNYTQLRTFTHSISISRGTKLVLESTDPEIKYIQLKEDE